MRMTMQTSKRSKAKSEAVRIKAELSRKYNPVAVRGITPGKLVTIPVEDFVHLDVDPTYQRGETQMVGQIVSAIQAGGLVLDPVTLVARPWAKNDAEKKWIIDGYQRVCAFQQLGRPFQAMLHESESIEAEKQFFLSLNTRHAVHSNIIVKSWTGPGAEAIAKANASPSHALYERVNYVQNTNASRIPASVLVRGALIAATGKMTGGAIQKVLSRLDVAMGPPERRHLATKFLQLAGEICPKGTTNSFVLEVLGLAAWDRWSRGGDYPSVSVITRLAKVNWKMEIPAFSEKFRPVATAIIDKIWKREE